MQDVKVKKNRTALNVSHKIIYEYLKVIGAILKKKLILFDIIDKNIRRLVKSWSKDKKRNIV